MGIEYETKQGYDRLFVYGIFLNQRTREAYGMENPEYATVLDYATFGHHIVQAQHIPSVGFSLTGLTVDVPVTSWDRLDQLEAGYNRSKVKTTDGEIVYMYTAK